MIKAVNSLEIPRNLQNFPEKLEFARALRAADGESGFAGQGVFPKNFYQGNILGYTPACTPLVTTLIGSVNFLHLL